MPVLSSGHLAFLAAARRAVLVTVAPDGTPRPVPVCFVLEAAPEAPEPGLPAEADVSPAEADVSPAEADVSRAEADVSPAEAGSAPDAGAPAGAGSAVVAWIPLDEKPKSVPDPRDLARVRDIVVRPRVALLVDRWSEDWAELAWLRCTGRARLVEPGELAPARLAAILAALRTKHPQYRDQALEGRPLIAVWIERATGWGRLEA